MSNDLTIDLDGEQYVVRPGADGLRVGRRVAGDVAWLDTVDTGLLPAPARQALDRGDTSEESLRTALRGIVQAELERGG